MILFNASVASKNIRVFLVILVDSRTSESRAGVLIKILLLAGVATKKPLLLATVGYGRVPSAPTGMIFSGSTSKKNGSSLLIVGSTTITNDEVSASANAP